jgi:hypothetical protein
MLANNFLGLAVESLVCAPFLIGVVLAFALQHNVSQFTSRRSHLWQSKILAGRSSNRQASRAQLPPLRMRASSVPMSAFKWASSALADAGAA